MTGNTAAYFIQGPGGFIIEVTIIQVILLLVETATGIFYLYDCLTGPKRCPGFADDHIQGRSWAQPVAVR